MQKLPEELEGIITEKQWNDLLAGSGINLNDWNIALSNFTPWNIGPGTYVAAYHKGKRFHIVQYGYASHATRGIYAALQLIAWDPTFLVEANAKRTDGDCLNLRV